MKRFCLAASIAVALAAWLVVPADAQKGKGKGKGGSVTPPAKSGSNFLPSGPGNSEPARPFDHPKSGNTLPKEIRDQLPPGLRDKPVDHPGVANHLRKLGWPSDKTADAIPPEVRSQLPPGLRD